jgi:hypothetical protein
MQAIEYQTEPPKVQRTLVVARDPETGKSKSVTLYGISPEKFIEGVRSAAGDSAERDEPDDRRPDASAA